jgi:hypothetical protein
MSIWRHDLFWPAVLVVVGVYFLLRNLNLLESGYAPISSGQSC